MRAWIFSDLHQDCHDNTWDPLPHAPSDFDIVIAAGDLHSPLTEAVDWLADRFAGCQVIYVPGNHDYYCDPNVDRYTHDDMLARGRDRAAARGVTLLNDDVVTIAGGRIVGATLWTDLRLGTYSAGHAMNTARKGMNDYKCIRRRSSGRHRHLRPEDTWSMHWRSREFIDNTLSAPFDGPSVVVTHHAPHPSSLWSPHADLRWCYASDMADLMHDRAPTAWIHGHVHGRRDYSVGQTRVVCNARGHADEGTSGFDQSFVVEV